jgi:hypothetical protein
MSVNNTSFIDSDKLSAIESRVNSFDHKNKKPGSSKNKILSKEASEPSIKSNYSKKH